MNTINSERYSKHSYRGFLRVCHNEVVASTPFSNDWRYLDGLWSDQFLKTAELQLDNEIFVFLKEKVKSERKGKGLYIYWQGIIEECGGVSNNIIRNSWYCLYDSLYVYYMIHYRNENGMQPKRRKTIYHKQKRSLLK
uniref:Uncharacterized protein n=1 Tax=Rhizophagus irregularis (strain DAOM 181602 / DAOM 197198 / MUCL 43194) TaxID=747089 RepID=U9SYB1_RHIID